MGRIGRIVIPGFRHHATQRGNRRVLIFFEPGDQALYRELLAQRCRTASVEVWAYCLMPNHVHLILALGHGRACGRIMTAETTNWCVSPACSTASAASPTSSCPVLSRKPSRRCGLREGTGRPVGSNAFRAKFERRLGRPARPQKPRCKPAAHGETRSDGRSS